MKDKYYVYNRFDQCYQEVEGKPIKIPVTFVEDMDLFIHRSYENKELWNISEGSTGCSIVYNYPTKEEAIEAAERVFKKINILEHPEKYIELSVAKSINRNGGMSPRYQE